MVPAPSFPRGWPSSHSLTCQCWPQNFWARCWLLENSQLKTIGPGLLAHSPRVFHFTLSSLAKMTASSPLDPDSQKYWNRAVSDSYRSYRSRVMESYNYLWLKADVLHHKLRRFWPWKTGWSIWSNTSWDLGSTDAACHGTQCRKSNAAMPRMMKRTGRLGCSDAGMCPSTLGSRHMVSCQKWRSGRTEATSKKLIFVKAFKRGSFWFLFR